MPMKTVYIRLPNVNIVEEMVNMISASRSFRGQCHGGARHQGHGGHRLGDREKLMNDLTISNLQTVLPETPAPGKKTTEAPSAPFSDYVQRSLADVNRQMIDADKAVERFGHRQKQGYTQYDDLHAKSRDLF
jgi:hypothetical protein